MGSLQTIIASEWQFLRFGLSQAQDRDRALYRTLARGMLGGASSAIAANLILSGLVAPLVSDNAGFDWFLGWWSSMLLVCALRMRVLRRARTHGWDDDFGCVTLCRSLTSLSALTGLLWGVLPHILHWDPSSGEHLFVPFLAAGLPAGALASNAFLLVSFIAFALPILLSMVASLLIVQPSGWPILIVITGCFLLFLGRAATALTLALRQAIALQNDRELLASRVESGSFAIKRKNEELDAALRAANQASSTKSEFLAKMSHEIRTPMNGILGMTALALDRVENAEQREALSIISESAKQLLSLINDILDHSKIESGKLMLEIAPIDLYAEVRRVERLFAIAARQGNVSLRATIDAQVPRYCLGDALRLGQVLTNLVSNAIKFTPSGGQVEISVLSEGNVRGVSALLFAVRDTGVGIPPEQQLSIFEAFVQADSSVTRKHGGSGLGLTISANLAALMGGSLTLESTPGEGSTFRFRVPLAVASESEFMGHRLREVEPQVVRSLQAVEAPIRVLVAEDNLVNQKLVLKILEREGFHVSVAANGQIALEMLREHMFDVILMDCQMPVLDGYEATKRIREDGDPRKARVPVIALTAHAMAGDREKCLSAGMTDYVTKPFDRAHLSALIRRLATQAPESTT